MMELKTKYMKNQQATIKDLKHNKFLYKNIKDCENCDDMRTFTCKVAKVIFNYLKPLCQNEYSISDTQQFPNMLSNLPPLLDDEEDVFDGAESLFTNIPIKDIIEYIIKQIYTHKKFKPFAVN